ncbi:MAG TPA: metal-dependent transcriptional regulator [Candidatus Lokiarchaeia archaeon]|nr:metal-dependent transcriptional regulator [Candidatus Lokiarchaeia archaeon]
MMETPEPASLDYQILVQFLSRKSSIRPGTLAEKLDISHSTINSALKRMESNGFVTWQHYGDIELTEKGRDALKHVEVHHHLIEVFLVDSLGLTPDEAHEESMTLAPHFSCIVIKKICTKYNNPEFCPSNDKIPDFPPCHVHDE